MQQSPAPRLSTEMVTTSSPAVSPSAASSSACVLVLYQMVQVCSVDWHHSAVGESNNQKNWMDATSLAASRCWTLDQTVASSSRINLYLMAGPRIVSSTIPSPLSNNASHYMSINASQVMIMGYCINNSKSPQLTQILVLMSEQR